MFTAKVKCTRLIETGEGDDRKAEVTFVADYNDGRNKEWAKYTPCMNVTMTLNGTAADLVEVDKAYTVTFAEDDE